MLKISLLKTFSQAYIFNTLMPESMSVIALTRLSVHFTALILSRTIQAAAYLHYTMYVQEVLTHGV